MNKPKALWNRNFEELRALLRGGGRIKIDDLKEIAKWAIFKELEWREKEEDIVRGLDADPDEYIEDLEEQIENHEKEIKGLEEQVEGHEKEIEDLEQKHEESMIAFAKEGAEIEL